MLSRMTEYQFSVNLPYIGSAIHTKLKGFWKRLACIYVYRSTEDKLFRSLCTHKDSVDKFQKPGVYSMPCECGLVLYALARLTEISHDVLKNIL